MENKNSQKLKNELVLAKKSMMRYATPSLVRTEFKRVKNIKQAIATNAPRLHAMITIIGDKKMEDYIELWLVDLNILSDVSRPLNDLQREFIATQIVSEYRDLTIADIYLIFTNAIAGRYGEFYENISPQKVLGWFSDYKGFRQDLCATASLNRHLENKESYHDPRNSEMTIKDFLKSKRK